MRSEDIAVGLLLIGGAITVKEARELAGPPRSQKSKNKLEDRCSTGAKTLVCL